MSNVIVSPQFGDPLLFRSLTIFSVRLPPDVKPPVEPPWPLPPPAVPLPPLAAIAGRIVIAISAAMMTTVLRPLRRGGSYGSPSRYSSHDFAMFQPPRYLRERHRPSGAQNLTALCRSVRVITHLGAKWSRARKGLGQRGDTGSPRAQPRAGRCRIRSFEYVWREVSGLLGGTDPDETAVGPQ